MKWSLDEEHLLLGAGSQVEPTGISVSGGRGKI